ncbi:hypothetical protein F5146DRAFT_1206576 [Armillaria mellea]|nr:hypothetical protein F5146DRAFT_1206576 [Armillaria mellea]
MSTISIPVDRILFVTYTPAAAMVLMLWDHFLTFGEEVATMWGPWDEHILTKGVHILNRYFTEAVLIYLTSELAHVVGGEAHCKAVVWLANISAVIIASISQSEANICSVLTTRRSNLPVIESQNGCAIGRIPRTVVCAMGVLLFFNVFVISMTIYNALEKPRRSENELLNSLRCDGARIYLGICILWLILLATSFLSLLTPQVHISSSALYAP